MNRAPQLKKIPRNMSMNIKIPIPSLIDAIVIAKATRRIMVTMPEVLKNFLFSIWLMTFILSSKVKYPLNLIPLFIF